MFTWNEAKENWNKNFTRRVGTITEQKSIEDKGASYMKKRLQMGMGKKSGDIK